MPNKITFGNNTHIVAGTNYLNNDALTFDTTINPYSGDELDLTGSNTVKSIDISGPSQTAEEYGTIDLTNANISLTATDGFRFLNGFMIINENASNQNVVLDGNSSLNYASLFVEGQATLNGHLSVSQGVFLDRTLNGDGTITISDNSVAYLGSVNPTIHLKLIDSSLNLNAPNGLVVDDPDPTQSRVTLSQAFTAVRETFDTKSGRLELFDANNNVVADLTFKDLHGATLYTHTSRCAVDTINTSPTIPAGGGGTLPISFDH